MEKTVAKRIEGLKTGTTYCTECGGTNVQVAAWINPNTNEVLDDFGSPGEKDTQYCADCDGPCELGFKQ